MLVMTRNIWQISSWSVLLALIRVPPRPTFVMRECFIDHWHQLFTHIHRPDFLPRWRRRMLWQPGTWRGWLGICTVDLNKHQTWHLHLLPRRCLSPLLSTTLRSTTVHTLQWTVIFLACRIDGQRWRQAQAAPEEPPAFAPVRHGKPAMNLLCRINCCAWAQSSSVQSSRPAGQIGNQKSIWLRFIHCIHWVYTAFQ